MSSSSDDPDIAAAVSGISAPASSQYISDDPDIHAAVLSGNGGSETKKGPTWQDRAIGAADIAETGILNVPHAIMGSAHDLYSRVVHGTSNHSAPLEAHLDPSGIALADEVKNSEVGKKISGAVSSADAALGRFSPTLQDVVHNAADVGGDVLNLAPVGFGATGAVRGFTGLADSAVSAGLSAGGREGAVALLKNEGIPLSVAQESGSKLAQHVERASAMTGDRAAEFSQQQGEALNKAVLKRAGISDATAATPDVMSAAKERIGNKMNDIAARNTIPLDDTLLTHLSEMQQEAPKLLPKHAADTLNANIDDIVSHAASNKGNLDGIYYQKLNARLGKLSSDPQLAPVAQDLREHINDAMERNASPKDVQDLQQARQQYRVLKQIEPAIDPVSGNISANKLMNSINIKSNRNQSLYGRGDQSLVGLARAAKMVLPDSLGNSGTAERLLPAQGAIETLGSGEPIKAAAKLVTGTVGLNAAGRVMRGVPGTPSGVFRGAIPGAAKKLPLPVLGATGAPLEKDSQQ